MKKKKKVTKQSTTKFKPIWSLKMESNKQGITVTTKTNMKNSDILQAINSLREDLEERLMMEN